jgi:arabinan endo-1,5-alpha-L-arabinosidase
MIRVARNSERGNPIEAPVVVFREGYYYLFVSYGLAAQGVRSTYRIVVGRSRQITGPYLGRDGRPMLDGGHAVVLKSSAPMFAPGHCDVMPDSSGRWLLAYHFYDARRFWVDDKWGLPTLQVRELIWDDAGWPLPGLPVQYPARADAPGSAEASVVGKWIHQADFSQPTTIDLRDDGSAVQAGGLIGNWTREGAKLTLRWPRAARDGPDQSFWIDTVQLAYGGKYYVGTNQTGSIIRGMRQQ